MSDNETPSSLESDQALQFAFESKAETQHALKTKELELNEYVTQREEFIRSLEREEEKADPNLSIFAPIGSVYNRDEQDRIKAEIYKLDEIIRESEKDVITLKEKYDRELIIFNTLKEYSKSNVKTSNSHMEKIGYKILEIQEHERKRIAMDLHDTTVQNLTTLIHRTELISKFVEVDKNRAKMELTSLADVIRAIINDMRTIIYDLRPMTLSDLGLVSAIQNYVERIKQKNTIQISFKLENEEKRTSSFINLSLYRILQEACNNCFKHANASILRITLSYLESQIVLQIVDNGIGFNYEELKENSFNNRFGLSIIEERVYLLQGELTINSKKNGTEIIIKIPIEKEGDENNESDKSNDC